MHDREGAEQMEMIYNWILKLSFFAVLGSVILQMIPDHGFQKQLTKRNNHRLILPVCIDQLF